MAQLARAEAVNAFVGLHTSHTLVAVEQALDGSVPYVFASGYEATRSIPGVYCPGETPAEFVGGLTRVGSDRGITSWAILGTDYVWPRAARVVERAAIDAAGAQVVLDELVPMGFGTQDGKNAVDLLHTSSCQGVILNMSGLDLVRMLEAIRTRGLDNLVRISNCLEENSLYALGGDTSGNLYSGLHSFESLRSPAREALDERRRSLFGNVSPVLNSWSVQCYDAVKLLADLDRHDALSSQALDEDNALGDVPVSVRPRIGGVVTPPAYDQHLAVAEGMSFEVL
ncbi:substrate-binding family protein [Kineococcus rhizosphaerae]|uniref:Substrate-binding family protein n=1 Tax=Kineococcus rhizosphaerae TaxID=559628 RepID=A0A2T0QMJ4_9ACTN|nr:substrate-binding family protein [Kineococcus rhizosphaerae]